MKSKKRKSERKKIVSKAAEQWVNLVFAHLSIKDQIKKERLPRNGK